MSYVLIAIIVALALAYLIKQTKKPEHFPPGPSWLPFIGSLPELRKLSKELGGQYLALSELAKKYKTNVLGLKLGNEYVVAVFSYPVIRTVVHGDDYDGRPDNFFMRLRTLETRKGFGKRVMENLIKEQISGVLDILQQNRGMQIGKVLSPAVLSILWALTSGSGIDRNDTRLNNLLELLDLRTKTFDMAGGVLNQHPWLRHVAPATTGYNVLRKVNNGLKKFIMQSITEHYNTWSDGANDDLIYSFITEMKKARGQKTTFTEEQLVMVCLDIFIAGAQTASTTLDFAFMMMILRPDIQTKVHACLDKAFQISADINYSDRVNNVPYLEAVLLEVERCYHVTPITGPQRVIRDTTLEGYSIPEGTTVLVSAYSLNNDKDYWGDPEVFRPERFLDENGKLVVYEQMLPFGFGRRRCIGEILAKQCLFLFFAAIMRKYKVSQSPGTEKPTGIPSSGITLSCEKYFAKFSPRCL